MKISDQTKQLQSGVDISTHSFFAAIAKGIQDKIRDDTGIQLAFVGKTTTDKGTMQAVLTGQFSDADPAKTADVQRRVELVMADMKNPSNLIGLLRR